MAASDETSMVTAREGAVTVKASRFMAAFNLLGLVVASVLLYGYFTWRLPGTFLTLPNIETIAVQSTIVSLAALGMTLIIVAGAIDLSIGSTVALVTVVIALTLPGRPAWQALLCGVIAGGLSGFFNGIVVTRLKVMPFIVTLGTMQIFRGVARGLGHDNTVEAPKTWLNDLLRAVPADERWKLFPIGVWIMIVMAVLVATILKSTVFGRNVVAVGSNETAARMSGIDVERTKLAVFVLGGVFAGFAGLMQFARLSVGDPTVAVGLELDVIAAVVIGGGSLSGGQGSILGAVIGAVFMTTMANGFAQIGLPEWVQYIVKGGIIVIAVALDRLRVKSA
jgi:ribose/xylose/arabinose/galactoside ABC-type transport system permease subunit